MLLLRWVLISGCMLRINDRRGVLSCCAVAGVTRGGRDILPAASRANLR